MTEEIAGVSAIWLILIFTISLAVFKIMHTSHNLCNSLFLARHTCLVSRRVIMKGLKFECFIWYFIFKRIKMEPNEFKVFLQWVWVHLHVFILYEM